MGNYTCNDYRDEMVLISLRKRLNSPELTKEEKKILTEEIKKIEKNMGMD